MKVRLEIIDEKGDKTSMEFEGDLSKDPIKEKILRFIEVIDLPSNNSVEPTSSAPQKRSIFKNISTESLEDLTIKERLKLFLYYEFSNEWFTSKEIKREYERKYERIGLSTVSTYLSRMYREGFLERRGNRVEREYKVDKDIGKKDLEKVPESV